MQLGAFYPFMRNHNDYGQKVNFSKHIWHFISIFTYNKLGSRSCSIFMGSTTNNETSITYEIFTYSILVHSLLSSSYFIKNCCTTTFLWVWIFFDTLWRALNLLFLFRYINDQNTYNVDQQFLVGSAILVSPNLVSVSN
jgi:hypothetical protein